MAQHAPELSSVARVGTLMRAPKTAELIASHLRRQIVRGELRPGETLPPEVHLMEQFGVSRPTLREAFRILEAESLIGVRRGSRGGAQVLTPDPMVAARHVGLLLQLQGTTLQDVYEARMVTEPLCAGMVARRRTEQDVADFRAAVAHLGELVRASAGKDPDHSRWSKATYHFHELVMQRCGNKTLAVQGAVLADIVAAHLQRSITQGMVDGGNATSRFELRIKSYETLVALIEEQDAAGAETHWRSHMQAAAQYLVTSNSGSTPVVDLFS